MQEPKTMRDAVRERLSDMANQINHMLEIGKDPLGNSGGSWPSHFMALEIEDPQWPADLSRAQRRQRRVSIAIREAIHAEERGDWHRHRQVLDSLVTDLGDCPASLGIWHHDDWEELRLLEPRACPSADAAQGFSDSELAFTYVMYACFYRLLLGYRFGTCHQCQRLYLKPLHGADSCYEKKACAQKAYRRRKGARRAPLASSTDKRVLPS